MYIHNTISCGGILLVFTHTTLSDTHTQYHSHNLCSHRMVFQPSFVSLDDMQVAVGDSADSGVVPKVEATHNVSRIGYFEL